MSKTNQKTSKSGKKGGVPKKSKMVTGYIIYASEIRKEIIKKHEGKTFGEISKLVGDEWKQLSQENKVAYEKRAQEQNSLSKMEFAAVGAGGGCDPNEEQQQQQQPIMTQQQQLTEQEQQSQMSSGLSIDLTTNAYNSPNNQTNSYSNYQQQQNTPNYYPQMMDQTMPMLIRQSNFNSPSSAMDALLQNQQQQPLSAQQQQQQPFQILQHQQQQQPIATMVQYCNNPACCCPNGARYQPYPYPSSPPAQPATPTSLQQEQPSVSPYKRNNIIYRRPIIIKLRPKDASTQTDPIKWVEKAENDSTGGDKKPLRFSQKFIDHMICATNSPTNDTINNN